MQIQATVNPRILTKSDRMFTGSLEGRITELVQNARRAGAKKITIHCSKVGDDKYAIRFSDDGSGILSFPKLLDLGGSHWAGEDMEAAEDPAGVGFFCLHPRRVEVSSRGKKCVIEGEGWHGTPVAVVDTQLFPETGTTLAFEDDEEWTEQEIRDCAQYSGVHVTLYSTCPDAKGVVNAKPREIPPRDFLEPDYLEEIQGDDRRIAALPAVHLPELGVRLRAVYRRSSFTDPSGLNFHGQNVSPAWDDLSYSYVRCLVDMTGEPTLLRLMLPARTRLVENAASKKLAEAARIQQFRLIAARGPHSLSFKLYQEAKQLGVDIGEAKIDVEVGAGLSTNSGSLEPPLSEPFRNTRYPQHEIHPSMCLYSGMKDAPDPERQGDCLIYRDGGVPAESLDLLAYLCPDLKFQPVTVREEYTGYSWTRNIPVIESVEIRVCVPGLLHDDRRPNEISGSTSNTRFTKCKSIDFTVRLSDGRVLQASPPVACVEDVGDCGRELFCAADPRDHNFTDQMFMYYDGGYCEDTDEGWDEQLTLLSDGVDDVLCDLFGGTDELFLRRVKEAMRDVMAGAPRSGDYQRRTRLLDKGWAAALTSEGLVVVAIHDAGGPRVLSDGPPALVSSVKPLVMEMLPADEVGKSKDDDEGDFPE